VIDIVRTQRGFEVVVEAAPPVEHRELALGAVQRGREGDGDRFPRRELTFVGGATTLRVGMGGKATREGHRDALGRTVDSEIDHQLRRHVAVQALPGK
jgi:hypothetical protein